MTTPRDPRTDPRPGDVMQISGTVYAVRDVWRDFIHFETNHPLSNGFDNTTLTRWRIDMVNAEVLNRAED